MPGPLTSAHVAIENCSSCHSKSGDHKLAWLRGLAVGDPHADSKACISCHKMPETALNPHGAATGVLEKSSKRLEKVAANMSVPASARLQNAAFPAHDVMSRELYCATCHQEHQGASFNLKKVSNEQCRSCHAVKFDSFDGSHPKFEGYPFKQRTHIIFDHAGHFGKHYPEVAKKDPAKRIPATCSTCHDSGKDRRVMSVVPFEKTCAGCHNDQITGKERATGPKGVAFLSVPGLDLQTLKKKNAQVGDWPDDSDAALTPFMKVMISRSDRGRKLIKTLDGLNLRDLAAANDTQIKAATDLAWEVKALFYALLNGKASDVLGDLNIGSGTALSPALTTDLTASLPRDVVASAQQEWLPNLATEMSSRAEKPKQEQPDATNKAAPKADSPAPAGSNAAPNAAAPSPRADSGGAGKDDSATAKREFAPPMRAGGPKPDESSSHDAKDGDDRWDLPSGTPRAIRERRKKPYEPEAKPRKAPDRSPDADTSGNAPSATEASTAAPAPPSNPGDQSDDLLFPTEAELRDMKSTAKGSAAPAQDSPQKSDGAAEPAQAAAQPSGATPPKTVKATVSIGSNIDPESWAEYGGWYRQDYAIYYRPSGHKDKFFYAWLFLTGPQAPKNAKTPGAGVFDVLTGKDAQGSCTKCHSVDDLPGKGRLVNFSPPSAESKQGRFTNFVHEPHFGIMEDRGCLTCHSLEKNRPYLKGYEHGNPQDFASNFGEVKQELCKGCHNASAVRQDCSLCHKYHVNGVTTPIISTKLPAQ